MTNKPTSKSTDNSKNRKELKHNEELVNAFIVLRNIRNNRYERVVQELNETISRIQIESRG